MANGAVIGVLSLQGGFREHEAALRRAGACPREVRQASHLNGVQGLVIPGGESTTMALVAQRWGLEPELRSLASSGTPVWGTCAGLILLADSALNMKEGGQSLVGGLHVGVSRNFFGAQNESFEATLPAPRQLTELGGSESFPAIFIRAPAITAVGDGVEVLAQLPRSGERESPLPVAVRQQNLLATAFHPELTSDNRWHTLFARMCKHAKTYELTQTANSEPLMQQQLELPSKAYEEGRPADLPVFSTSPAAAGKPGATA